MRNILLEMLSRCPLYLSQGPAALERKEDSSELTHPPGRWKPSNVDSAASVYLMWSVVHLPRTLIKMGASIMSFPSHALKGVSS